MSKRYVVIGASRGIGFALVQRLLAGGHRVEALGRDVSDLVDLDGVNTHEYDASNDAGFPDIDGAVDGLVYCPGTINLKPFNRLTIADFTDDFNVNVLGAVRTIQAILPNLKQAENASIVLFSTVAVETGMGFHASIAAAKGAVEGLTRSLAAEFAPKIRVNCIAPSLTDTTLAERLIKSPEHREASAARHPLKRIGTPDDSAAMAAFLLSCDASWVTGQIIHIDGGMSAVR